jgi:hypothetical protein
METNLKQAIDEKIRKLQMLRELADDPEAIALLQSVMGNSNGSANPSSAVQSAIAPPVWPTQDATRQIRIRPIPAERVGRGRQQRTVEETLNGATEPVTTDWIANKMIASGYVFSASRPQIAVNECLRCAAVKGLARIARRDGVQNYWEAIKSDKVQQEIVEASENGPLWKRPE